MTLDYFQNSESCSRFFIVISNFPLYKTFFRYPWRKPSKHERARNIDQNLRTAGILSLLIYSFLSYFEARASFVRCRCSLSRARSFTHVRADVKRKAYRISRERCPESAGVSCDVCQGILESDARTFLSAFSRFPHVRGYFSK